MTAAIVPLRPERESALRAARHVIVDPDYHDVDTVEAAREVLAAWGGPSDRALAGYQPPPAAIPAAAWMIAGALLAVVAYTSGWSMAALLAGGV